jgi:6-methylsalicylate decarboxylase
MDDSTPLQSLRLRHCDACAAPRGTSRRSVLFAALGSAALAACSTPSAPTSAAAPNLNTTAGRIDVHHHIAPTPWLKAGRDVIDPLSKSWTVQRSLDDMDRAGVASSVVSITTPGIVLSGMQPAAIRQLARECNEFSAKLTADHRGRFGFFAALPMLDTEGSLREIAYSLDVLKADGIGLLTSYGDKWLGDPMFFPIMEELNRRKAVVYTHPTAANCCTALQAKVPPVMIEFGTDTTRTIASILFDGNARRFRDIRWIFSHAGGTMPFLVERFVRHPLLVPSSAPLFPEGVAAELKRFHYDTAQASNPAAMSALTKVVPVSQVVFGTDYPYRTSLDHVNGLRSAGVFSEAEIRMIERGTALTLLPRLRA